MLLEYDEGIPENAADRISGLLALPEVIVEKKGKNGITEQNIVPMIQNLELMKEGPKELRLNAMICCQNPTLNPSQLVAAIEKYLPDLKPDFVRICRKEIYNTDKEIFR